MRFELILLLPPRERDWIPRSEQRIGFGARRLGNRLEPIIIQSGESFLEQRPCRRILRQMLTFRRFHCDAKRFLIAPALEVQYAAA
jgi:hypothetical protein